MILEYLTDWPVLQGGSYADYLLALAQLSRKWATALGEQSMSDHHEEGPPVSDPELGLQPLFWHGSYDEWHWAPKNSMRRHAFLWQA